MEGWPEEIFLSPEEGGPPLAMLEVTRCGICKMIARNPSLCPLGHLFCRECIEDWLRECEENEEEGIMPRCPADNQEITVEDLLLDRTAQRWLDLQTLRCTRWPECQAQSPSQLQGKEGNLDWLHKHLDTCSLVPVVCLFLGCRWQGSRQSLLEHLHQCPFRTWKCDHCHQVFLWSQQKTHESECPEWPLVCPLACEEYQQGGLRRGDLKTHLELHCTQRVVICGNSSMGCDWQGSVTQQVDHEKICLWRPGPCPQGCEEFEVRPFHANLLRHHLEVECPHTLVVCPQCQDPQNRQKRSELIHHQQNACPRTKVPCPFYPLACPCDQVCRGEMENHLRDPIHSIQHARLSTLSIHQTQWRPIYFQLDTRHLWGRKVAEFNMGPYLYELNFFTHGNQTRVFLKFVKENTEQDHLIRLEGTIFCVQLSQQSNDELNGMKSQLDISLWPKIRGAQTLLFSGISGVIMGVLIYHVAKANDDDIQKFFLSSRISS